MNARLLEEWWEEAQPTIDSLMAAASLAIDVSGSSDPSASASCDQIKATSRDANRWLAGHPCPSRAIAAGFARLVARYATIATLYEKWLTTDLDPVALRSGAHEIRMDFAAWIDSTQEQIDPPDPLPFRSRGS